MLGSPEPCQLPPLLRRTKRLSLMLTTACARYTMSLLPCALTTQCKGHMATLLCSSMSRVRCSLKLLPGDVLHQDVVVGRLPEVFGAFHDLWSPMWNKHVDTAPGHWTQLLDALLPVLPVPPTPFVCDPVTVDEWRATIRKRKATSAMGPDGVTRQDLLCMGPKLTAKIVQTINDVEQGNLAWPHSTMVGLISSVEKHEQAQKVGDFRPITVLSQIYRTWASIRSKKLLAWIATFAPVELAGNKPNTSTKGSDDWGLSSLPTTLSGLVSDLTKCFNTIPRFVVSAIALRLGVPMAFVHCWHQAVTRPAAQIPCCRCMWSTWVCCHRLPRRMWP